MTAPVDVDAEAASLLKAIAAKCTRQEPQGSMSLSIYCTAWVSMVTKPDESIGSDASPGRRWLFPESFQFILQCQSPDSYWHHEDRGGDEVDGILNTMACLLSILKHRNNPSWSGCFIDKNDLDRRVEKGVKSLKERLDKWDVLETDHVAFEILVPAHLKLLQEQGIQLSFPGYDHLIQLQNEKLAAFKRSPDALQSLLNGAKPTTLLHSLEAFTDKIDFNQLKHRLQSGSMMYSPSSTAAYLMGISAWDEEAEAYLRMVQKYTAANHLGGFPAAFPSENFDFSWILSTFLEAGYSAESLGQESLNTIGLQLEKALIDGGGVTGFTANVMPDADDTAKSLQSLYGIGRRDISPSGLIQRFGSTNCFRTYPGERNASFSANCNALIALLLSSHPDEYRVIVIQVLGFLKESWWTGGSKDKWNTSEQYSSMLLSRALALTLLLWDQQRLSGSKEELLIEDISLILAQICNRTLLGQLPDGSWSSGSCEVTAYALITLKELSDLPFLKIVTADVHSAINAGRHFLQQNTDRWEGPWYLWVEKITYSSKLLAKTYCLAAMKNRKVNHHQWSDTLKNVAGNIESEKIEEFSKFFEPLPLFSGAKNRRLMLRLAVLEGLLFLPLLRAVRTEVFPRTDMAEDKWLEYIPLTWTCCNYLLKPVQTEILFSMMRLSMLNYQADEYMEAVFGPQHHSKNIVAQKAAISQLFEVVDSSESERPNGRKRSFTEFSLLNRSNGAASDTGNGTIKTNNNGVHRDEVLERYIIWILGHPAVSAAHSSTKNRLRGELETFLVSHAVQNQDNSLLSQQRRATHNGVENGASTTTPKKSISQTDVINKSSIQSSPLLPPQHSAEKMSFHRWVNGIAANHTSAPFSWIFYECLISPPSGSALWIDAKSRYLTEEVGRRLATLCRMYNDLGSVDRDYAEDNLNSLDFPEFGEGGSDEKVDGKARPVEREDPRATAKAELMYLADYEREGMERAMERLQGMASQTVSNRLWLLINVTDFFGQIYVARDIASRMK